MPINSALQHIGHKTDGTGNAVDIQFFFENVGMMLAVGCHAYIATTSIDLVVSMFVLGAITIVLTGIVSWHMPKNAVTSG